MVISTNADREPRAGGIQRSDDSRHADGRLQTDNRPRADGRLRADGRTSTDGRPGVSEPRASISGHPRSKPASRSPLQ